VHVGRLHVEIRTIGRADAALSQTHGPKTVQVPSLSAIVFAKRPLVAPHEEALMVRTPSRAARRERERERAYAHRREEMEESLENGSR